MLLVKNMLCSKLHFLETFRLKVFSYQTYQVCEAVVARGEGGSRGISPYFEAFPKPRSISQYPELEAFPSRDDGRDPGRNQVREAVARKPRDSSLKYRTCSRLKHRTCSRLEHRTCSPLIIWTCSRLN